MSSCYKCQSNSCKCNPDLTCLHVDLFGSPFDCKKQIPTPRFSSPNSPLPPKALDRLQRNIEEANDLLRSLGSESDPANRRQLQLHFLSIRGADVSLKIICEEQEKEEHEQESKEHILNLKMDKNSKTKRSILQKKGKIFTAGRDFIQINQVGASVFVLYDRLIYVARDECEHVKQPEQELIDVDRKVRRELAFNFGDFVSKKPELVNLFFGIPLYKQLKEFLGGDVKVKIFDEEIVGTLVKVDEGVIQVLKRNDNKIEINLNEICFIKVVNLK
jgi:hypothetical protein